MFLNRAVLLSALKKQCFKSSTSKMVQSVCARALSSASNATMKTRNDSGKNGVSSELIRALNSEIEAQKSLIEDEGEEMQPEAIVETYSDFLTEGKWTLNTSKDSTLITLTRREESLKADVCIKFDLVEVFNEIYNNEGEEFDAQDEENYERSVEENKENVKDEMAEMSEEIDEDFNYSTIPISVEIKRDSIPGKSLLFECVLEGDESESDLVIENVSIMPAEEAQARSSYVAPTYSQLDEGLQESFESFLGRLVKHEELLGFVKNYSVAREAEMYQNWLHEVRDLVKN